MKKKDPNEEVKINNSMSFVTPQEKTTLLSPEKTGVSSTVSSKDSPASGIEHDESIERLVSYSSNNGPIEKDEIVDLTESTIDHQSQSTSKNVVSAQKKKPAAKRKPAAAKKSVVPVTPKTIANSFPVVDTITTDNTEMVVDKNEAEVKESEEIAEVDHTPAAIASDVPETSTEKAAPVESSEANTDAPITHTMVTPAAVPKKRTRKPTTKKTEAVESVALDIDAGDVENESEDAKACDSTSKAEKEDVEAVTPAAKRVRKAVVKPTATPTAVVYPPHVEIKIQTNKEKLAALVQELVLLER